MSKGKAWKVLLLLLKVSKLLKNGNKFEGCLVDSKFNHYLFFDTKHRQKNIFEDLSYLISSPLMGSRTLIVFIGLYLKICIKSSQFAQTNLEKRMSSIKSSDPLYSSILTDSLKTIIRYHRNDEAKYLDLIKEAKLFFHPHHQVFCQICKWFLPIFCRKPGLSTRDFPVEKLAVKLELCKNQLDVFDIVCPGLTKYRGNL